jgi:hypothetical protein
MITGAEQEAVVPPLVPEQPQLQGPVPVTEVALPLVQRLLLGALLTATPLAEPQTPLTGVGVLFALQLAVVPVFAPVQLQLQGPEPVTEVAVPLVQRLVVGAVLTEVPLAVPHAPLTIRLAAPELSVVPPLVPAHPQVQPVPVVVKPVTVPAEQRPGVVEDKLAKSPPLSLPTAPLTGVAALLAEHEEVVPPLLPSQLQLQGPEPVTEVAVPVVQRLVLGALLTATPLAEPQTPLTGVGVLLAEQEEVVPPLLPSQLQLQGPVPVTEVALPAVQRLVVGALLTVLLLAVPQAPLTGVGEAVQVAEQEALVPPAFPGQVQVRLEPETVTSLRPPAEQ